MPTVTARAIVVGHARKLWIEGPVGRIEAVLRIAAPARAAAVLAHPHPLHGGTLHNPVVFHADRELNRAAFTTLRFNFRGVGTSEGVHDDGRGEVDDLGRVAVWLRGLAPRVPLLVVGYSFGSVCALRLAADDRRVAAVLAIGLPVRLGGLEVLDRFDRPLAVVQGAEDEFGSVEEVRRRVGREAVVRVIDGATHLFAGRAADVGREVSTAAESLLALCGAGRDQGSDSGR